MISQLRLFLIIWRMEERYEWSLCSIESVVFGVACGLDESKVDKKEERE